MALANELFHSPTDDNKWCPGGYREYVTGGWSFKSLSRGLEGIIDTCPGGSGTTWKIVQGGGAKQKLVQGAFTSLSLGGRGIIQACPGVFL